MLLGTFGFSEILISSDMADLQSCMRDVHYGKTFAEIEYFEREKLPYFLFQRRERKKLNETI